MQDLKFWRLLHEEPTLELVPFLAALAERPLKERIPFLGHLPRLLQASEQPELRLAILAALEGAAGRKALQLFLDHFEDPDPTVAAMAVEGFARSVSRDPLRWAHAVFHPSVKIRRLAAARQENSGLSVYLLADPQVREHVRLPDPLPHAVTPAMLEWLRTGAVDRSTCRALLTHHHLIWLLGQRDSRSDVSDLLGAFWDDDAPAPVLWARLSDWLQDHTHQQHRQPIAELMLGIGRARQSWPLSASSLLFGLRPATLVDQDIARDVRYRGLQSLYSTPHDRRIDDKDVSMLLKSDLIRTEEAIDLWALGAVMSVCRHPHHILDALPFQALVQAVEQTPLNAAFLFLSPRFVKAARKQFARLLQNATGQGPSIAAGLLAAGDYEAARAILKEQPGNVAEAVFALEGHPGYSLGPAARERVVDCLVQACVAQPAALLRGRRGPLPQACLALVAEKLEPEGFLEHCLALSNEELERLLETIDQTSSFPYSAEGLMVQELAAHPDPAIAAWSAARTLTPALSGRRPPASVTALTESQQAEISGCAETQLPEALAPALRAPSRQLVSALGSRTPGACRSTVSQALVGCHDGPSAVAQQWERFGPCDDNDAVTWSYQPDLPLHGHCRLDRFDFHTDRVEQSLSSLAELVEAARHYSGPMTEALWRMVARLCSRWRFRNVGTLEKMVDPELLVHLVNGLEQSQPRQAAIALCRLWQAQVQVHVEELIRLRPRVLELLPDLDRATRLELHDYVGSQGMAGPTVRRRGKTGEEELREVRGCADLEKLSEFALDPSGEVAAEAALRLLDFAETGAARLLSLLLEKDPPHAPLLAETAGMWPDGPSRATLVGTIQSHGLSPEVVFSAGLSLLETGEKLEETVLQAACRPSDPAWFLKPYWDRLLRCGLNAATLSRCLAASPHPHAYSRAVEVALREDLEEALVVFLESGWDRFAATRHTVARRLWELGDTRGFPIPFPLALDDATQTPRLEGVDLRAAVDSVMIAGTAAVQEKNLVDFLLTLAPETLGSVAPLVLGQSRRPETCQALLGRLPRTARRQEMLTRVAGTYLWGVKIARQLTGRLFTVEMHGGEELGFTRLEESRIYVNPLPMFRGDRHGQEVVEGLILHELGHHIYHRGADEAEVWKAAQDEGVFPLLNLVSDEHLERNLRAMNVVYDQKLKRLAAFAFLHSRREVKIVDLLLALQHKAFDVLTHTRLTVAAKAGCLSVRGGDVLNALENHGSSFMRFVRGLRMGRGNRHADPLVARALALFPSEFRGYSLRQQHELARELRRIFGHDADLARVLSQDGVHCPDNNEVIVVGEGLTPDEMRREMERLSRGSEGGISGGGRRWLNKSADSSFPPLTTVVPVAHDAALAREYASEVARHAQRLREVFARLGLAYQRQTRRVQGYRVDRARIPDAILRGEVRILQARRLVVETDLFLGVVVDCSGSMHGDCMHKARLFATLVARAVDGLAGVELRVLGFTDSVVYDAGAAHRCAAHNLQAGGGNNDAGALDFAANLARRSRRRARLLIMISDGLPTQCSVQALSELVAHLTRKEQILCAQVAVRPLKEICFPNYIELSGGPESLGAHVAEFARVVARLASRSLRR